MQRRDSKGVCADRKWGKTCNSRPLRTSSLACLHEHPFLVTCLNTGHTKHFSSGLFLLCLCNAPYCIHLMYVSCAFVSVTLALKRLQKSVLIENFETNFIWYRKQVKRLAHIVGKCTAVVGVQTSVCPFFVLVLWTISEPWERLMMGQMIYDYIVTCKVVYLPFIQFGQTSSPLPFSMFYWVSCHFKNVSLCYF